MNEIYYWTKCTERTHRLSLALCKRAKESGEVVWLTVVSKTLQAPSFRMLLFTSPHPLTHHPHTPPSHATLTLHPQTHPQTPPPSHTTLTHTLAHILTHTLTHTTTTLVHPHTHPHTQVPPQSTEGDVEALRSAISEVRTVVAVPVMQSQLGFGPASLVSPRKII